MTGNSEISGTDLGVAEEGIATFSEDAVYSREALRIKLEGIVTVDLFVKRLGIPLRFKNVILGSDILRAMSESARGAEPESSEYIAPFERSRARTALNPSTRRKAPLRTIQIEEVNSEKG